MVKDKYSEELEDEFSSSDYAEYYNEYYSDLDEQEIERTNKKRSGLFSRSKMYIDDVRTEITDEINGTIELQKEYYQQSDNDVLYHQQISRNKFFYRQLAKILVTGGILIGILYLFLLIGR